MRIASNFDVGAGAGRAQTDGMLGVRGVVPSLLVHIAADVA